MRKLPSMMNKLLNNKILNGSPTESIAAAAFIISAAGIASRVLGLIRDRILAAEFGAGDVLDTYYAAFRIPDLVYNLLVLGALSAAFIPVFTGLRSTQKENEAWKLASGLLNLQTMAVFVISGTFAVFSPWLLHFIVPGFSDEKIAATAEFSRIMFLSPVLLGISAIFGGILVSFKKFLVYSLAPIFYNIGIIIGVLFLVPVLGAKGLAWGVVLGAGLHLAVQYPAARNSGYTFKFFSFSVLRDEQIKKVIRLMIPRALGIAVNQINLLIITFFASSLAAGSIAIFTFANNIQAAPMALFGSSFAIAAFPLLSASAAKKMEGIFLDNFQKTLKQILFFIVPISVIILVLRAQIVRVILGSGNFDWEDTVLTFQVLGILSLSLFAQSLVPLLSRSFFALQDTKTPFYVALASEFVNIGLVLVLLKNFSILGLAMAFSAASVVNMTLLYYFLMKRLTRHEKKPILDWIFNLMLLSGTAGIVIQVAKHLLVKILDIDTFIGIFLQLTLSLGAGLAVFAGLCHYLRIEEYQYFRKSLLRRIWPARYRVEENIREVEGVD